MILFSKWDLMKNYIFNIISIIYKKNIQFVLKITIYHFWKMEVSENDESAGKIEKSNEDRWNVKYAGKRLLKREI